VLECLRQLSVLRASQRAAPGTGGQLQHRHGEVRKGLRAGLSQWCLVVLAQWHVDLGS